MAMEVVIFVWIECCHYKCDMLLWDRVRLDSTWTTTTTVILWPLLAELCVYFLQRRTTNDRYGCDDVSPAVQLSSNQMTLALSQGLPAPLLLLPFLVTRTRTRNDVCRLLGKMLAAATTARQRRVRVFGTRSRVQYRRHSVSFLSNIDRRRQIYETGFSSSSSILLLFILSGHRIASSSGATRLIIKECRK